MGDRLTLSRKKTGVDIGTAAAHAGVSRQTLSRWERGLGENGPTAVAIVRLADLYGESVDYLFGRAGVARFLAYVDEAAEARLLQCTDGRDAMTLLARAACRLHEETRVITDPREFRRRVMMMQRHVESLMVDAADDGILG